MLAVFLTFMLGYFLISGTVLRLPALCRFFSCYRGTYTPLRSIYKDLGVARLSNLSCARDPCAAFARRSSFGSSAREEHRAGAPVEAA